MQRVTICGDYFAIRLFFNVDGPLLTAKVNIFSQLPISL